MSNSQALKCGYCGFILRGSYENVLAHQCFEKYKENTHVVVVDDNAVVTMCERQSYEPKDTQQIEEVEGMIEDSPVTKFSSSNLDEILIDLVHVRRGLWDHSIPTKNRTKLKKEALWQEVVNALEGSLTLMSAKQKWRQLRDSYVKARKRMQGYVRSGSGADAAHPQKSSFSHYERMRFLDDTLQMVPTINSQQHLLPKPSQIDGHSKDIECNNATDFSMDPVELSSGDEHSDTNCQNTHRASTSSTQRASTSSTHRASTSSSSSCLSSRSKNKKKLDMHTHLEEAFAKVLNEAPRQERDAVDSYLEQMGDILRRLPYI